MKKINAEVRKGYIDKYTGLTKKPGNKITVTDARFRELNRGEKRVEIVKPETTSKKEK